MPRTPIFAQLARTLRIAHAAATAKVDAREAVELARASETSRLRRRTLFKGALGAGGALLVGHPRLLRAGQAPNVDVAIVGAGLAGLVCADRLEAAGVVPTLYEAASRVGGRVWSMGGGFNGPVMFPGQVVERGGELIDNLHKTMLAYANEFDLAKEDMNKEPGAIFYYLGGEHVPEEDVVDEFRAFVDEMQDDLRASTGAPTADSHNDADVDLDLTTLAEYLESRGAGPLAYGAIEQAYKSEYGLEIDEQSALNFLLFIHADRRSKFTPYGVFSDERWHLVGGNEQIPANIHARLEAPTHLGHRLVAARRTAAGQVQLTFKKGSQTITRTHDAVVLTIPFSVLRGVDLDPSLELPAWKTQAIDDFGYGMNAKTMVGFNSRPWRALGALGTSYSDLANHQTTWETNPTAGSATLGVLTDYASGLRGESLSPSAVQSQVSAFLNDLDVVFPGAKAAATKLPGNKYRAHLEHWPSNPNSLGSYTCYLPGQFTSIAGNEGKSVDNLYFAGEHTNSFYEWQGFMEGACLSGIDAADAILADWG
ncbi:MAG: FAD-dependent oxidoreductase [Polyangiaceae bacterium]|nr:FAD-dependent oxidoreductase [Polyangiaceae bacterium]